MNAGNTVRRTLPLMCIPMLLIAGFLVVTGAGGTGVILALVCLSMMAAMMFMMPGGHNHK